MVTSNLIPSAISTQAMSTKEIASLTGKRHADVLRDTRVMLEKVHGIHNANLRYEEIQGVTVVNDDKGRIGEILLDQRNSLNLVSGYEPKLRDAIIGRWLELEEQRQMTPAELILRQAQELVKQEARIAAVENAVKMMDGDTGYRTVLAHSRVVGTDLPLHVANAVGRKAAAYCKKEEITIGRVPDQRFGTVGSYPIEVLEVVFEEMKIGK